MGDYTSAVQAETQKRKSNAFKEFASDHNLYGKPRGQSSMKSGDKPSDSPSPPAEVAGSSGTRMQGTLVLTHELGETKHGDLHAKKAERDHVMVMPVQQVQEELGHLEDDEDSEAVKTVDKIDDDLSANALKELQKHDEMSASLEPTK